MRTLPARRPAIVNRPSTSACAPNAPSSMAACAKDRPDPVASATCATRRACAHAPQAANMSAEKSNHLLYMSPGFNVRTGPTTRVVRFPWRHYPPRFFGYDLSPDFRRDTPLHDGAKVAPIPGVDYGTCCSGRHRSRCTIRQCSRTDTDEKNATPRKSCQRNVHLRTA